MELPRQESWSGLPFPTPGNLPDPGIETASLVSPALAGRCFTIVPPGEPKGLVQLAYKPSVTDLFFLGGIYCLFNLYAAYIM